VIDTELDRIDFPVPHAHEDERPEDYGLPHDSWRPHQLETVHWVEDGSGVMICEQPTGSGKSAVAASQSISRRTVSLVRTKYLQTQYGDIYGAHVLMGKGNYPCDHPDNIGSMADECLYPQNMYQCPFTHSCEYMIAKKIARSAPFVSTNYAYWLTAKSIRDNVKMLVCDEAHLLSDITLDWAGMTISAPVRRKWDLPEFPLIRSSADQGAMIQVEDWLRESTISLMKISNRVMEMGSDASDDEKKRGKQASQLAMKLGATLVAIHACTQDWFIRSGPGVGYYRGMPVPAIIVRPLTAKYHFPRIFMGDWDMLLMSATIGDEGTFCGEMGILDYDLRRVPNQFSPEERPIYALDVPRLSYKSKVADYDRQADEIAKAILDCPKEWSGIIHVTRKNEAAFLANRLARRGLQGRMWVPPQTDKRGKYLGTGEQMDLWDRYRDTHPGTIMVAWQFMEGADLTEEKICVIAKVPFPSLGDEYEKARMKYSNRMYLQRTAWTIMQAAGRTRRGRPQDYDLDGERRGLVAIADANWVRIKKYMSPDFLDAIVPWKKG